jgi:hypothetical protein
VNRIAAARLRSKGLAGWPSLGAVYEPGKNKLVERWRGYVAKYLSDAPEDFILAWINEESGGNPKDRTALDERGIMQVMPSEATDMGMSPVDFDFLLLGDGDPGYDPDRHFQISTKLVRYKQRVADAYLKKFGVDFSGQDYWTFVKLVHGLPSIAHDGMAAFVAANGHEPASFDDFANWIRFTNWTTGGRSPDNVSHIIQNAQDAGAWAGGSDTDLMPWIVGLGLLGTAYLVWDSRKPRRNPRRRRR